VAGAESGQDPTTWPAGPARLILDLGAGVMEVALVRRGILIAHASIALGWDEPARDRARTRRQVRPASRTWPTA
jgi:hypothetical protein